MKIVFDLHVDTDEDRAEVREYVEAVAALISRRQWQEMPGALLNQGGASIWVTAVRIEQ